MLLHAAEHGGRDAVPATRPAHGAPMTREPKSATAPDLAFLSVA